MRALMIGGCLAMSAVVACDRLTAVDAPDVVQPKDYATAAGATALASGALTHFYGVFGGNGHSDFVVSSQGAMSDELMHTSATGAAWDLRDDLEPSLSSEPYSRLHEARQRLLIAIRSLQRAAPDSVARIGQMYAFLGFTNLFFGELHCAGVPLSSMDDALKPVYGQPLTLVQMFDSAVAAFDSALVYAVDSARIHNLARVGRGRALLNAGRFAEASLAVAAVPTNYVYNATYVAGTLQNGMFSRDRGPTSTTFNNDWTVPEVEGTNGINWRSANDPRVTLVNRSPGRIGQDGVTHVWMFSRYQTANAPIVLAGGIEARLIEAEAFLQAGDNTNWLARLNALRALGTAGGGVNGLTALTDPGTAAGRVNLHFRERAFWLFLTGHRLGDLRRLVRQYGRNAETVFPTGIWRNGISYKAGVNMAPPAIQENNPNYTGCLNRNP